jgi:hypothetical protein
MSEMKAVVDAVALLRDENLVWSTDMQDIRLELATLLEVSANNDVTKYLAEGLAKRILFSGTNYNPNLELR